MRERLRLCCISPGGEFVPRLLRRLRRAGEEVDLVSVGAWREALTHLTGREARTGVVVHSPGLCEAPEVVAALRGGAPDAMLVVVVDASSRTDARGALRRGADALVHADRPETLGDIVRALLRRRSAALDRLRRLRAQNESLALRLHEEIQRAGLLLEQSPAVVLVAQGGLVVRASAAAARLVGAHTPAELEGRPIADLIGPGAWQSLERSADRGSAAMARARSQRWRLPGGVELDMETTVAICAHAGSEALQIVAMDVTRSREVSRELNRRAAATQLAVETLEGVLDALPAEVAVLDMNGRIVSVNASWRRFAIDNGADEVRVCAGVNYLDECDRAAQRGEGVAEQAAEAIRQVLEGRRDMAHLEYPCHAPREDRFVRMLVAPLHSGGSPGAVVMHVDVTERRRAVDALAAAEGLLRASIDATGIGCVEVSPAAGRARWDARAASLLGFPEAPGAGRTADLLANLDESEREAVLAGVGAEGAIDRECRVRSLGGEERWVGLRGASANPSRLTLFCWDVTERRTMRAAEEERQHLRGAVQAMEQVLGLIGHELRTPMASIRAVAELLIDHGAESDEQRASFLESIRREATRAGSLVNDALDAARLNSGVAQWRWSEFALAEVCEEVASCLRPLADGERLTVHASVEPPDLSMRGDCEGVRRLIMNLTSNAVQHTPGGHVRIAARAERDFDASWVVIEVADTGEGVAPLVAQRLGEAFALNSGFVGQGFTSGAGLGLAICRSIAAAHGGAISFVSRLGEGTVFTARMRADLDEPGRGESAPPIEGVTTP